MIDPLDIGDDAEIPITVTRATDGQRIDPTAPTAWVRSPAGVETTYVYPSANIVRDALGVYRVLVPCTVAGVWVGEFRCPGPTGKGMQPFKFHVRASASTVVT